MGTGGSRGGGRGPRFSSAAVGLTGRTGLDLDVSVQGGRGGATGGTPSGLDRIAPPGARGILLKDERKQM